MKGKNEGECESSRARAQKKRALSLSSRADRVLAHVIPLFPFPFNRLSRRLKVDEILKIQLRSFSCKTHLVTDYATVKLNANRKHCCLGYAYKRLKLINNKVDKKKSVKKVTGKRDPQDNAYIRFFN